MLCPKAKECRATNKSKARSIENIFSLRASRRNQIVNTLISDFGLEPWDNTFLFKSHGLWYRDNHVATKSIYSRPLMFNVIQSWHVSPGWLPGLIDLSRVPFLWKLHVCSSQSVNSSKRMTNDISNGQSLLVKVYGELYSLARFFQQTLTFLCKQM